MGSSSSKHTAVTAPSRAPSPVLRSDPPGQDQHPPPPSMLTKPPSPFTSSPTSTPSTPPTSPPFNYAVYEYEYTYPFCPCCHRDLRESCDDHRDAAREQDSLIRRSFEIEREKVGMNEEHGADKKEWENTVTGGTVRWERDLNDLERVLMWPHLV